MTGTVFSNSGWGYPAPPPRGSATGGLLMGIPVAVALMMIFASVIHAGWFDFLRELTRLQNRLGAYFSLLTDKYPSTVDEQAVRLELRYPNVQTDFSTT